MLQCLTIKDKNKVREIESPEFENGFGIVLSINDLIRHIYDIYQIIAI